MTGQQWAQCVAYRRCRPRGMVRDFAFSRTHQLRHPHAWSLTYGCTRRQPRRPLQPQLQSGSRGLDHRTSAGRACEASARATATIRLSCSSCIHAGPTPHTSATARIDQARPTAFRVRPPPVPCFMACRARRRQVHWAHCLAIARPRWRSCDGGLPHWKTPWRCRAARAQIRLHF